VRARSALESRVELERLEPVGRAGRIHRLQEASLRAAPAASESTRDCKKGQESCDESHENMAPP
jgi:hypothetical protein